MHDASVRPTRPRPHGPRAAAPQAQCWNQVPLSQLATSETQAGWTKCFAPLAALDCTHEGAKPEDLNR